MGEGGGPSYLKRTTDSEFPLTFDFISFLIVKWIRELSFFTGRGGRLFVGGPEFFGVVKGGDQFFSVSQRGDQNFLRVKEGGPKFLL